VYGLLEDGRVLLTHVEVNMSVCCLCISKSITLKCISWTCEWGLGNRLSGDRQRNWEPLFSMRQVCGINKRKEIRTGEWHRLLKSSIQPSDLDLDGTGLDESKCWTGRADTLMLTITVYNLLVLQTKRYLFGSTGERWIAKQYMEQKKWLNFFTL